jgi:hypothetical protein
LLVVEEAVVLMPKVLAVSAAVVQEESLEL